MDMQTVSKTCDTFATRPQLHGLIHVLQSTSITGTSTVLFWQVNLNLLKICRLQNPNINSSKYSYFCSTVKSVLRDRCHEKPPVLGDQIFLAKGPTFQCEPVTKDHLSRETTFVWPKGWSFKTGSTILVVFIVLQCTTIRCLKFRCRSGFLLGLLTK